MFTLIIYVYVYLYTHISPAWELGFYLAFLGNYFTSRRENCLFDPTMWCPYSWVDSSVILCIKTRLTSDTLFQ